jgi:hypothetical protein
MPVNTPNPEYEEFLDIWERCRDCYAGTDAVKSAKGKYLPPLDSHNENAKGYDAYVMRALFYNATGRTVDGLSGAIFQKPPRWDVSKKAEEYIKDITMTGVTGEVFALRTTRNVLGIGRWGILVDMPPDPKDKKANGANDEAKGEKAEGVKFVQRPYFVGYQAEEIINWKTTVVAGDQRLQMVVLREKERLENPDDEFVPDVIEQYRVLRINEKGSYQQEIWRKVGRSDKFALDQVIVPRRRGKPLNFIPFVFMSAISIEPSIEKPPIIDLVATTGRWQTSNTVGTTPRCRRRGSLVPFPETTRATRTCPSDRASRGCSIPAGRPGCWSSPEPVSDRSSRRIRRSGR